MYQNIPGTEVYRNGAFTAVLRPPTESKRAWDWSIRMTPGPRYNTPILDGVGTSRDDALDWMRSAAFALLWVEVDPDAIPEIEQETRYRDRTVFMHGEWAAVVFEGEHGWEFDVVTPYYIDADGIRGFVHAPVTGRYSTRELALLGVKAGVFGWQWTKQVSKESRKESASVNSHQCCVRYAGDPAIAPGWEVRDEDGNVVGRVVEAENVSGGVNVIFDVDDAAMKEKIEGGSYRGVSMGMQIVPVSKLTSEQV